MANGKAFFYIVQPMPEDAPGIIKLGHARDLTRRLKTYRTLCPMARVLASWQSVTEHERAAIRYITAGEDCQALGKEVFRCQDVTAVIARAEQFFSLDTDTLARLAALAGRAGGGVARLSQPEMIQRLREYKAGRYVPRSKAERQNLRRRLLAYTRAGVLID